VSLRVDCSSQRSSCFNAGTSVARDNRPAISVQTHFFRYRQCGSCRQARALDAAPLRLARRGGRKVEKFDSNGCAHGAREARRRRRCIAIVRRRAPRRRRARETTRRRRKCAVRALGVEEKVIARESAQGQVRRKCALVGRRRRSGRVGVRAENACAGGAHLCGGESVQGTLGCAQGTRGGRRVRSDMEWQGGAQTPNGLVVCPTVLGVE